MREGEGNEEIIKGYVCILDKNYVLWVNCLCKVNEICDDIEVSFLLFY